MDSSQEDESYFDSLLAGLREKARLELARRRLARSFVESLQPARNGHFAQICRMAEISGQTLLEKRPGTVCHVSASDDRSTIYFPGGRVRGPLRIESSLHFVARAAGPFACLDLPGPLSENAKLILVRRLVASGLLRIAEAGSTRKHEIVA